MSSTITYLHTYKHRAYKLGKKRWSYNQFEIRLQNELGDSVYDVKEALQSSTPASLQHLSVCSKGGCGLHYITQQPYAETLHKYTPALPYTHTTYTLLYTHYYTHTTTHTLLYTHDYVRTKHARQKHRSHVQATKFDW